MEMSSGLKAWLFGAFCLIVCMSQAFLIRQNRGGQTLEEVCESACFLGVPRKAMRPVLSHTLCSGAGPPECVPLVCYGRQAWLEETHLPPTCL